VPLGVLPAAMQPPPRARLRDVQMHAIVYDADANGGPGTAKMELTPDMLNVTWQKALNMPGQAAFTVLRFNKKLSSINYMVDHIKLFRESRSGVKCVFAGKIVKPNEGPRDVILSCYDYKAFLQFSISGFRTLYPNKAIGTGIVLPEWQSAQSQASSVLAFVGLGNIENPLGLDGITPILTNEQFGVVLFDRLFMFFSLAELSMANTANSTIFEITDEAPHVFNFWANRSAVRTNYAFSYPGNLMDFSFDPGFDSRRNELLTPINDGAAGQTTYAAQAAGDWATYRRLSQAVSLKTLIGLNTATLEADQMKAGIQRMLSERQRNVALVQFFPRQGELEPFVNWDLGDRFTHSYQKSDRSGDRFSGLLQTIGLAASWTPDRGELLRGTARAIA
jgi:hypothetical protein